YRIKWNENNFEFYVDSSATPVATISLTVSSGLYLQVSDVNINDGTLSVDWLRATPYVASGTYTSRVADAGAITNWGVVKYNRETPVGTTLAISVRTGNSTNPEDGTWSTFTAIDSGVAIGRSSRYAQYKAVFSTSNTLLTPVLKDLSVQCGANGGARLITQDEKGKAAQTVVKEFNVKISPNPFESHFNLFITGSPEQPATVRVLDIHGRIAEQHQKVTVNSNVSLGNQLPGGVYFVEVLQGSKRKMVKVIKQ
ncbi:MAG TPA: T9SS type A sorting domain-containing protein, partial [Niastella sp.]|nr:T9SS type A sorting domain-containing protein [Niastella sp.]